MIGAGKFIRGDKTHKVFELIGLEGSPKKQPPLGFLEPGCLQGDTAEVMQSSQSLMKAVEQQTHQLSA